MKNILKTLYNSGIYLLVSLALLLIITSIFWILGLSLLKLSLIISFISSAIICYYLLDSSIKNKILSIGIAILVLIVSIFISGYVYDQSDDGNTYHKETIYMLKEGWNPIYENYQDSAKSKGTTYEHELWAEHYPKTTWILAATIYDTTNNIETGKFYNIIFIYITFVIFSYILYTKFNKKILSLLLALIVVINPITTAQTFSYYVDGLLGLLLFLVIIHMYLFIKNDKDKLAKIILTSLIIIISNIKFTGLAYCGLFCLGYYIYYIIENIKNNNLNKIIKNTIYFMLVVIVSVLVVGSSSYLKNTIDHKHPFYPLMGKDKVDIMTFLQPASFKEMTPIKKNFYSIFSKTANIGVFNNREPELKIPFTFDRYEVNQITYDTRIGGYGIFFSGIFILSIILLIIFTIDTIRKKNNTIILYLIPIIITILLMFFLSDSWWARYAPQLYLFVLIPLLLLTNYKNKTAKIFFMIFSIIILFNSILCFKTFYYNDFPKSNLSKIELNKNNNKEINIYLSEKRFTGILANLKDKNIKYNIVNNKTEDMKSLYGNYVNYSIIE